MHQRDLYKNSNNGSLNDLEDRELDTRFGLLVVSGTIKDNHLPTKTNFDTNFSGDKNRATMSKRRFNFLLDCFRFYDRTSREPKKKKENM